MLDNEKRSLLDVTNFAIEQENEGIKFFINAANKTQNPLGKAMFTSFVEDERDHIKRIKMMTSGMITPEDNIVSLEPHGPRERLKTIFEELIHTVNDVSPDANDLDAIKVAMNIERKVYKFYEIASTEASNSREKELYKFLAREEIIHFQILKNAYNHLSNLSKWNLKESNNTPNAWMELIREKDPRFN